MDALIANMTRDVTGLSSTPFAMMQHANRDANRGAGVGDVVLERIVGTGAIPTAVQGKALLVDGACTAVGSARHDCKGCKGGGKGRGVRKKDTIWQSDTARENDRRAKKGGCKFQRLFSKRREPSVGFPFGLMGRAK